MNQIPFSGNSCLDVVRQFVESTNNFPVDFDILWRWCGYSRKNNAKRTLFALGFTESIDYRLLKNEQSDNHATLTPFEQANLSRTEKIYLTLDSAKHFALASRTEQGKQVRNYFIQVEKEYRKSMKDLITKIDFLESEFLANKTDDITVFLGIITPNISTVF